MFDSDDIYYLAKHFNTEQLRHEIKIAWSKLRGEYDWHWQMFYEDFIEACRSAIKIDENIPERHVISKAIRLSSEEIKQKNDIVDYIGQYVKLRRSGKNFNGPCPFHSERSPSFYVYTDSQTWHCFGACNTGGDIISFVMKHDGVDFKSALYKLSR